MRTETTNHFPVQFVREIEYVSGVRIEHESNFNAKGIGALRHPSEHPLEAVPIRLTVLEGKQGGYAKARIGNGVNQFIFSGLGPHGLLPLSGWLKFGKIGNHHHIISHFSHKR